MIFDDKVLPDLSPPPVPTRAPVDYKWFSISAHSRDDTNCEFTPSSATVYPYRVYLFN